MLDPCRAVRTRRCTSRSTSFFFFQAEDGIRDHCVNGVQTCALPIYDPAGIAELLERKEVELVVINRDPGHSRPLDVRIIAVLQQRFPHSLDLGRFTARWRERSEERRVGKEWSTR